VKVFTDHKAAEDILTSKILKITSYVRMNLRLIRASQCILQYPMVKVVYRPGRDNVNADALSRLTQLRDHHPGPNEDNGEYTAVSPLRLGLAWLMRRCGGGRGRRNPLPEDEGENDAGGEAILRTMKLGADEYDKYLDEINPWHSDLRRPLFPSRIISFRWMTDRHGKGGGIVAVKVGIGKVRSPVLELIHRSTQRSITSYG